MGSHLHLEFDELDVQGQFVQLDIQSATALADSGLVQLSPRGDNRWRVDVTGKVGSVAAGDTSITVSPHATIGVTQLFFLLDYAENPFVDAEVPAQHSSHLWPSIAQVFATLVSRALAKGPIRGYRHVEDALPVVRGRIRISDQLTRRPGSMIPLEVAYSDYTHNIAENQILATALHYIRHLADADTAGTLARAHMQLREVDVITAGAVLPAWTRSRVNSHLVPALKLAERIIRNSSIDTGNGAAYSAAFVAQMPHLFDRFVSATLQSVFADISDHAVVTDQSAFLDRDHTGSRINVEVGTVITRGGSPVAAVATTYPTTDTQRSGEHFKLLAACTALGVKQAFLIYPATRGNTTPTPRKIVHTDISITEFPLDLSQAPAGCRERLQEFASSLS